MIHEVKVDLPENLPEAQALVERVCREVGISVEDAHEKAGGTLYWNMRMSVLCHHDGRTLASCTFSEERRSGQQVGCLVDLSVTGGKPEKEAKS